MNSTFRNVVHNWENFCKEAHTSVNQSYGENDSLPYSFHLDMVNNVRKMYMGRLVSLSEREQIVLEWAIWGHDLMEDTRMTYNDVKSAINNIFKQAQLVLDTNTPTYDEIDSFATEVADVIYLCTDFKGKNREERKPPKFWEELSENKVAMAAKMCDTLGNARYSHITNSRMLRAYTKKAKFYREFVTRYFGELSDVISELEYIARIHKR